MWIALSIVLACVLVVTAVLFLYSPGRVAPYTDENGGVSGSVSEKIFVTINGVKQGMVILGRDVHNPVLLFLHGGPGMPEYFLAEKYLTDLETDFTVCYWEQRGAGISYDPKADPGALTPEQMISDILAVTDYIRERFDQAKIYLMAHSGGTFFGIQAAAQAPEKYRAYIAVSQISWQDESEKQAYDYMLDQYTAAGNTRMVQKLKAYPVLESESAMQAYRTSLLRDQAMHELGIGTMHGMHSVLTGIFLPVMECRAYTLAEKIHIWQGKTVSQKSLRGRMDAVDLPDTVSNLQVPVYFMSGIYDYTVSYTGAKTYFSQLEAPVKGFYTFDQSAHSPQFEETEEFLRIMREDVLTGTAGLADTE